MRQRQGFSSQLLRNRPARNHFAAHLRYLFSVWSISFILIPFLYPVVIRIPSVLVWQIVFVFFVSALPELRGRYTRLSKWLAFVLGVSGLSFIVFFHLLPPSLPASNPFLLVTYEYLIILTTMGVCTFFWKLAYQFILRPLPLARKTEQAEAVAIYL